MIRKVPWVEDAIAVIKMPKPCYQCTHWNGYVGECYLTGRAKRFDQTCKKFKKGKQ